MDTRTGEIGTFDELLKKGAKEEDLVPLSDAELAEVHGMNRKERRKWATLRRREAARARKKGRADGE